MLFVPPAAPTPARNGGGVIVVGEWWGIDSAALQLAAQLADSLGVRVFALDVFRDGQKEIPVDLKRGYETPEGLARAFGESAHKMATCDWASAVEDVGAVAAWLKQRQPSEAEPPAAGAG